ncbi:MAG: CoA ester lyase [Geminicoccaceae bacterium]|nr:CoA ester lyase [Geminicoccaceae bacterium]
MSSVRPRRSMLYMPGSNSKALEKGKTLPADSLILDLEDAVAPDAKRGAREALREVLEGRRAYGERELIVRVNGLDTPWGHADLVAMAASRADGILLPKVESADNIRRALTVLEVAGGRPDMPVWCMIETPRGVLHVEEIADQKRVAGLVMGTSDLTTDLYAEHTPLRLPMLSSLSMCLLAARAARIAILDGVYLDLADDEGYQAACRQGRELGFDGKTLIHPKQIEAANAVFGPTEEAVTRARRIMEAFQEARAQGKGVVVVDGKLVENLHVAEARRLVALAETIAARR